MDQEWLPSCIQGCLKQHELVLLGRYSEAGAKLSRAILQWRVETRLRRAASKRTAEWNESLRSGEFVTTRKAMILGEAGEVIVATASKPAKSKASASKARPAGVKQLPLSKGLDEVAEQGFGLDQLVWDVDADVEAAGRSSAQKVGRKGATPMAANRAQQLQKAPPATKSSPPPNSVAENRHARASRESRKSRASYESSKSRASRASTEAASVEFTELDDEAAPIETGESNGDTGSQALTSGAVDATDAPTTSASAGPTASTAKVASKSELSNGQEQEAPADGTKSEERPLRLGLTMRDRLVRNLKAIGYSNTKQPVLSRYLVKWRGQARLVRVARAKIKLILETASPDEQEMRQKRDGFEGFRTRCPRWIAPSVDPQVPFTPVHLDSDAFWARAKRNEASYVQGAPFMTKGVYSFAVRVSGVCQGMVVGVCDASSEGDATAPPPSDARAWGLHLTHGALYCKKQGRAKGTLSIKQLVDIQSDERDDEDFNGLGGSRMGIQIEIEVDMDRQRIAFCKPGERPVEAPVTLSTCVRPWALLWNSGVAVQIDSRLQGSGISRMRKSGPGGHRSAANLRKPPMLPLRAQAQWIVDPITGEKVFFGGSRPREFGSPRQSPEQRAALEHPQPDTSLYLPKFLQAGWDTPSEAVGTSIKAAGMQDEDETAGGLGGRLQRRAPRRPSPRRGARSPGKSPGRYALKRSPATPGGAVSSEGPNTPASWRQYALSARASPNSPRTSRERSITHMWDMVRYVTGVYADVPKQV